MVCVEIARGAPEFSREWDPDELFDLVLDPFNEPGLIAAFTAAGVTAISLEMIPRTTLAQKMDKLLQEGELSELHARYLAIHQTLKRDASERAAEAVLALL